MNRVARCLPWLAGGGVLLTLCVMGFGAFTRLMDAGLGCPDWPGCYGHWVVPSVENVHWVGSHSHTPLVAYKAWIEMAHRYVAGSLATLTFIVLLSLIFLSITIQKTNKPKQLDKTLKHLALFSVTLFNIRLHVNKTYFTLAIGLLLLIIYQILLGRWTVTLHLLPIIVTQHLLGAMGILSLLWLTVLFITVPPLGCATQQQVSAMSSFHDLTVDANKPLSYDNSLSLHDKKKWMKYLPVIGLILLLLQIFLGAWTSTHYASLSCTDFPFCHNEGTWFPNYFRQAFHISTVTQFNYEGGLLPDTVRQTIHMTHRLGAVLLSIYLLFMVAMLLSYVKENTLLFIATLCTVGVLLAQITLGVANVLFQLPLAIAVAHNLMASLLLLCLVTLCYGMTMHPQKGVF